MLEQRRLRPPSGRKYLHVTEQQVKLTNSINWILIWYQYYMFLLHDCEQLVPKAICRVIPDVDNHVIGSSRAASLSVMPLKIQKTI